MLLAYLTLLARMFVIDHIGINAQPLVKAQGQEVTFFNEISKSFQPAKVCLPIPEDTPLPEPKSSHETQIVRSKSLGNVRVETSFINHDRDNRFDLSYLQSQYVAEGNQIETYFRIYRNEKLLYEEKKSSTYEELEREFSIRRSKADNNEYEIVNLGGKGYTNVFKYDSECQGYKIVRDMSSSYEYHTFFHDFDYAVVQTRNHRNLTVKITYKQSEKRSSIFIPRLNIFQSGQMIFSEIFDNEEIHQSGGGSNISLKIIDSFNGDYPQIVIYFLNGGTWCCNHTYVYYFDDNKQQFAKYHFSYPLIYNFFIEDIEEEGNWVFVRTYSNLPPRYFREAQPILIQRFSQDKFIDVTRQFPEKLRNENEKILIDISHFDRYLNSGFYAHDRKGFQALLTAYLANSYMLGEGEEGWEFVDRVYREADRLVFFYRLSMYLRAGGYSE